MTVKIAGSSISLAAVLEIGHLIDDGIGEHKERKFLLVGSENSGSYETRPIGSNPRSFLLCWFTLRRIHQYVRGESRPANANADAEADTKAETDTNAGAKSAAATDTNAEADSGL